MCVHVCVTQTADVRMYIMLYEFCMVRYLRMYVMMGPT